MDPIPNIFPTSLRSAARTASVRKDQPLFRQGDPVDAIYQVISGQVQLVRYGEGGEVIVLHRAGSGEYFAEASLTADRYHCSALALQDSSVRCFPAALFRQCLADDPAFAEAWMATLADNVRTLRTRLERMHLKGARQRIVHYLLTETADADRAVTLPYSLSSWADELGLARETLYRTLAELEREGQIERQGLRLRLRRR